MRSATANCQVQVATSERAQLLSALVESVDAQGYEATSVRSLLDLAGLSRGAFHRHFASLEECFLAAVDAMADQDAAAVAAAYARPGSWEQRLRAAFDAAIERLVDRPAAARTCIVGVHAAGAAALRRDDWAIDRWVRLVRAAFAESPERADLPTPIVRGIVGGVRRVVHTRLRRGDEAELPGLADGLCRWALSYTTPPGTLPEAWPPSLARATNGHADDQSEQAIRVALTAMLLDLAEHPAWARRVIAAALTADSAALGRLDERLEGFRVLLRQRTEGSVDDAAHALVVEAITGAILSLCHAQIRRHGPRHLVDLLPAVTSQALAPFAGS